MLPKPDWFTHDPMTTEEADSLLSRYASRNIKAYKTLATDPRYWIVQVDRSSVRHEPLSSGAYAKSSIWSFI